MKIVHVAHGFPPMGIGGSECYVQKITEGLRDRGHDLFVYAGTAQWMEKFTVTSKKMQGFELTLVHRNDLYFDRWDKVYNPLVEENFRSFLKSRKPDVVHLHQWLRMTSNLCSIAAGMGIPVIVTLHDHFVSCPRLFRVKDDGFVCKEELSPRRCSICSDRWLFQNDMEIKAALESFKADFLNELQIASRVLAPSLAHAEFMRDHAGLDAINIEVAPLGSLNELKPAPTSKPGEKLRIVFFSSLYLYKGPKLLIEAYLKMKHQDKAELHIFGNEPLPDFADELKALAAGKDIYFHGAYKPNDLEKVKMDLIVIPTLAPETYSFILDEAAWLDRPVLASNIGAIPERARGSAMLFRAGDVDDLAESMDKLVTDRTLLTKLANAPSIDVTRMNDHLDYLEKIYCDLIEKGVENRPAENDMRFVRIKDQWARREFGFRELVRSEEWESLAASLRKRIAELESALDAEG